METIKGFIYLSLILIGTVFFGPMFGWGYSFIGSLLFVVVGIPVISTIVSSSISSSKYKNIPDADKLPDLILNEKDATDWEIEFCNDLKDKFKDPKFSEKITRKQLRKLIEVYLERVRRVPEKEIDITKIGISMGDKKMQ